jgi:eukaryotic-like serine/threonine-protein kinase
MGEVYKARDTRLNRTVAVKVLPSHISGDAQAKQRFEREARAIAALKHPHICVLYDVGVQDGVDYLVMEHLEGVTLAERLKKGALPVAEAVKIGLEVVDALDKAHRSDVIHRDFKPGNIMLTADGAKLLDFGLAKVRNSGVVAPSVSSSAPTDAATLTGSGSILGTLQYMAPEQIEGQESDARTDIFAFGAVLYEMITGRRAFQGKSQPSLIAAILSTNPQSPSAVNAGIPPALNHVIERCLAKDPADRWHTARDLWMELKWASESGASSDKTAAATPSRWVWIALGALVLLMAALIPAALYFRSQSAAPGAQTRFDIPVAGLASPYWISISPDGRRVAYVAGAGGGKTALWIRPLNSLDAQMLPGTEGASVPDWSPDSKWIVFAQDGKVKKLDVTGGPAQTILDLRKDVQGNYTRSTWNADGTIIFGVNDNHGLRRVSAGGGEAVEVTEVDRTLAETAHNTPWFLPDGRHFLYTAWSNKPENRAVYIASLDSKSRTKLMPGESKAIYVPPGVLLFLRERTLMARPFDAKRLEFTGDAVPIVESISYNPAFGQSAFSVSAEGTLIFYRNDGGAAASGTPQWSWIDRTGKASAPIGPAFNTGNLRLSPDGKRVVYVQNQGGVGDIWVYDVERNSSNPLTRDPGNDEYPIWSPDGQRVVFGSNRLGDVSRDVSTLYEKASNGATPEQVLLPSEPETLMRARDWSVDGRYILIERYKRAEGPGQRDLWVLPLFGDRKPFPYLNSSFDEAHPVLSPNGRWLAYASNEGGMYQVIVQSFPDPKLGKWQISSAGGVYPRWKRDGRELYYLDSQRQIVAVSVKTDGNFEVGKSTPLFVSPLTFQFGPSNTIPYDVSPDGQRFLISAPGALTPTANVTPITVVLNWVSALKH